MLKMNSSQNLEMFFAKFSKLKLADSFNIQLLKGSSCMVVQIDLGPVVRSVVSLTSSLRVISLTVLADSIYNILIFFAEKM